MKTLSIKQPWASLIAHGIKDIENRTWKTKFRGRIFIHASAKAAGNLPNVLSNEQARFIVCNVDIMPQQVKDMPFSAIIGEVDIIDCVINHHSIWADKTDLYKANSKEYPDKIIYNWVLANPVLYDKPILNVKGSLSLWDWKGCDQTCESCEKVFDMDNMQRDGDDNYFCNECADELFPVMKKEYEEMVAKGEIDPEDD